MLNSYSENNYYNHFIPYQEEKVKISQNNRKTINSTDFFNTVILKYQNTLQKEWVKCQNSAKTKFSHFNCPDSLESNLALAQEILDETIKAVPFSPNYLARSEHLLKEQARINGYDLTDLTCLGKEFEGRLTNNRNEKKITQLDSKIDRFKKTKASGKIAKKTLIGNCGEMSDVALFIGMKKGIWNVLLEECTIINTNKDYTPKADHVFIVMGRKPGSDPKDYKTWGTAVVIDIWAKKIFKLDDLETHLYDLDQRTAASNRTGKPNLRRFDPTNQKIRIYVGNIFPTADLRKYREKLPGRLTEVQLKLYDKIVEQLDCFHQAKDLNTKLDEAYKLSELCCQQPLQHFPKTMLLKDQVDYFLKIGANVSYDNYLNGSKKSVH